MERSILTTIKLKLGIMEEDESFDPQVISNINTQFLTLHQLGVGPKQGFRIDDDISVWSDFVQDVLLLGYVEEYIYLNVKLLFDPPASGSASEAINRKITEYEERILYMVETIIPGTKENEEVTDDEE